MKLPLDLEYVDRMKSRDFGRVEVVDRDNRVMAYLYYDKKAGSQYRGHRKR